MKRPNQSDSIESKKQRLNESSLIRSLKSKLQNNTNLRLRHFSEPLKFLQAEEELFMAIRALDQLAGTEFDKARVAEIALDLLEHENTDIVMAVIDIVGLLEISSGEISDRLAELFVQDDTEDPTRESILRAIGNFDGKYSLGLLKKLLQLSISGCPIAMEAAELFARSYSGDEILADDLFNAVDQFSEILDLGQDDKVDILVYLLNAMAACESSHFERMLSICCTAISDHSIDVNEAALRVIAVVAAKDPSRVLKVADVLYRLLSVDQPSSVVTELTLEILARILEVSDAASLANSNVVSDIVIHYATATEKISDLQDLMGDKFRIEEVPSLPTAKFAAQLILAIAEIHDGLSEILEKAEIPLTEVSSFAIL